MKSEITLGGRILAALVLCVALNSCGDDPQLVLKRDEQRAEITRLQGELSILQERMEQIPPDRSAKIAELKQQAEDNRAKIATLESEVEALGKEKDSIEKQEQAYRRKYVVK